MKIVLYTKTGCPWCREVLNLFFEKKVQYEERDLLKDAKYFDELEKKSNKTKTPTLEVDGEIFADTDKVAVEKILREKGYPGF